MLIELNINDKVSWVSNEGHLNGTVTNIYSAKNAKKDIITWVNFQYTNSKGYVKTANMPYTDNYMAMMKVIKL